MTWTAPTVSDFKTRFPAFADQDEATITMFLNEAVGAVSPSWLERDRTPAVLYLTAHLLASEGAGAAGAGGGVGGSAATGQQIKAMTVGDVKVEYDTSSSDSSSTGSASSNPFASFFATIYGRRYYELAKRNFPSPRVV